MRSFRMGGGFLGSAVEPSEPALFTCEFKKKKRTTLTRHNSDWVNNVGSFSITGNTLFAVAKQISVAHYQGVTFAADQYAEGVLGVSGSDGAMGVAVRCAAGDTATAYVFYVDASTRYLVKYLAGSSILIDSEAAAASDGDAIKLVVTRTTLTPYVNGEVWGPGAKVDSSIAVGYPGVCGRVDAGGTDFSIAVWTGADKG